MPGIRQPAQLDPGREALRGHFLRGCHGRDKLHPGHAGAGRAHQPGGEFFRDAGRHPHLIAVPAKKNRQRHAIRILRQPGRQCAVPSVIGEQHQGAPGAELARMAGKHTQTGRLPALAGPPRPGLSVSDTDGDHHAVPQQ
jgi:hypothetical protein